MQSIPPATNPIYVFIDESGNFDFSAKGTDHLLMAAVIARDPINSAAELQRLKYNLLSQGIDVPHFHASEDKQFVRDLVFPVIDSIRSISAHVIYVNKHRAAPVMQNQERMYSLFGGAIAKYLLLVLPTVTGDQVIIVFDKALSKKNEGAFLAKVKPILNSLGRPYRIFFQSVNYDFNGQIADYIAWAKFVSLERSENRPLAALANAKIGYFDLFRTGHTIYY